MAAAARKVVTELPAWRKALQKWAYNKSGFGKLGLMMDDCIYETPEVEEAIRRLPADVYDQRNFRISRAIHLSCRKEILPKAEQLTLEDDVRYLKPYLEEVQRENAEKSEWNKR